MLGLGAAALLRAQGGPVAKTAYGSVRGVHDPRGLEIFKGIPYARADRFRAPVPPTPWTGVRDAVKPGAVAPQNDDGAGILAYSQSEDCLHLNVWTPALDRAKRPVLFYIHGGAHINGTGASSALDGTNLVLNENVVVVTINYRLGVLGYPPFPIFDNDAPRNLGLLDQVAALRWVRDHIGEFGGDPGNVTVFGLSAGGWTTVALMVIPQARGLFHRAAPESPAFQIAANADDQAVNAKAFLDAIGTDRPAKLVDAPVADLLRAQQATIDHQHASLLAHPEVEMRTFPFIPVQDSVVLKDDPIRLMEKGDGMRIPLFAGGTSAEIAACPFRMAVEWLAAMHDKARVLKSLERVTTSAKAQSIYDGYVALRRGASEAEIGGFLRSDFQYRMPVVRTTEFHARRNPTWMYDFDYSAPSPQIGIATHAFDTAFWFGNIAISRLAGFFFGRAPNEAELGLSRMMQRDLAAFARTGKCSWAAYRTESRWTKVYSLPHSLIVSDPRAKERMLWDGVRL